MIRFAIVPLVALDIVERMLSRPVDRRIHESETTRDRHQYDTCHADGTAGTATGSSSPFRRRLRA